MQKGLLCLDLGTHTGWARTCDIGEGTFITSGVEDFSGSRFDGGGVRYLKFKTFLLNAIGFNGGVFRVFYEGVQAHTAVYAAQTYGGFMATLTSLCEELRIPYEGVPVGTIKKYMTGNGRASKDAMVEAVSKRLGKRVHDHNEADALAILFYASEMIERGRL